MSNVVLNPKTHAKIARLLESAYKNGFNSNGFTLSTQAKEIIKGYIRSDSESDWDNLGRRLYEDLYLQNLKGQAKTYPKAAINFDFIPDYELAYWDIWNSNELHDEIQAYKSIQCYLYNSACDSPLASIVKEVLIALGNKIIQSLEEYKQAVYG